MQKKKRFHLEIALATGWDRTNDIRIFSPALYQLSYCGVDVLDNIELSNLCQQANQKKLKKV